MFSLLAIGTVSLVVMSSALGQGMPKPNIATVDVANNYEFGTFSKSFRVQYPGICEETIAQKVEIKIKNIEGSVAQPVLTFNVPIEEVSNGKVYYFGLKDAQPGRYSVEVCVDENNCSDVSKSLTELLSESEIPHLTCHRVTKKSIKVEATSGAPESYKWEIINKNAGQINIIPLGVQRFMNKEELDAQHDYFIWKSKKKGSKCQGDNLNPCFADGELYLNYFYNLTHVNELFIAPKDRKAKESKGKEITVADEYCGRKFLLSTNVHLLDHATKEVKYRFKTTLNSEIPILIRDAYMYAAEGSPLSTGIPVESLYTENIAKGKYEVWVANCFTEKDKVDSTICAKTFIQDSFVVGGTN